MEDANKQVRKTIVKELQRHDKEEQLREQWKEQQLMEAKIRDEVYRPITEAAKAAQEKADREDYQRRRAMQLQETQARIDREKKELEDRVERELFERRTALTAHWGKERPGLVREAHATRTAYMDGLTRDYNQGIDDVHDEWGNRVFNKARQQVEAPGYSNNNEETEGRSRFGIFGRQGRNTDPDAQGDELLEEDPGKENYVPFLDTHDVKIFSSEPNTMFEERNSDVQAADTDLAQDRALYEILKGETKSLAEAMERMCQLREAAERDALQAHSEGKLAEGMRLLVPPKRLPGETEKEAIHDRRERQNLLKRRISDLQYSINKTDERKRNAEAQMLSLARRIAVGKDKSKQMHAELDALNGPLGMLPVVVGRGLKTVKGLSIHQAKPREFMEAVRQKSTLVGLQELSKQTLKQFKDRNALDQELWITAEENFGRKDELEKMHT